MHLIPNGRGPHLSASERRIRALEQQIATYEQMAAEYNALMNYLCRTNAGYYHISATRLQACEPFLPIRTEITRDENRDQIMELTLVHPESKPSRLILPR